MIEARMLSMHSTMQRASVHRFTLESSMLMMIMETMVNMSMTWIRHLKMVLALITSFILLECFILGPKTKKFRCPCTNTEPSSMIFLHMLCSISLEFDLLWTKNSAPNPIKGGSTDPM